MCFAQPVSRERAAKCFFWTLRHADKSFQLRDCTTGTVRDQAVSKTVRKVIDFYRTGTSTHRPGPDRPKLVAPGRAKYYRLVQALKITREIHYLAKIIIHISKYPKSLPSKCLFNHSILIKIIQTLLSSGHFPKYCWCIFITQPHVTETITSHFNYKKNYNLFSFHTNCWKNISIYSCEQF